MEAEVLAGLLAADELERQEGNARRRFQTAEERAQWPDLATLKPRGMAEDHHLRRGQELEEQHAAYRKALSRVGGGAAIGTSGTATNVGRSPRRRGSLHTGNGTQGFVGSIPA